MCLFGWFGAPTAYSRLDDTAGRGKLMHTGERESNDSGNEGRSRLDSVCFTRRKSGNTYGAKIELDEIHIHCEPLCSHACTCSSWRRGRKEHHRLLSQKEETRGDGHYKRDANTIVSIFSAYQRGLISERFPYFYDDVVPQCWSDR